MALTFPKFAYKRRLPTPWPEVEPTLPEGEIPPLVDMPSLSPLSPSLDMGLGELPPFSPPAQPQAGIDLAEEQAKLDALSRLGRDRRQPLEPVSPSLPPFLGGFGERIGGFAEAIGKLPTPSLFAPSEAMTVGELGGQLAEPVGKGLETLYKKVGQPAGGALAVAGLGPMLPGQAEDVQRRVQEKLDQGMNLWQALGAVQEERPEYLAGEKFIEEFLADPLNLIGLGWEPKIARALAQSAQTIGKATTRTGKKIAEKALPAARRVLEEEAGGIKYPGETFGPQDMINTLVPYLRQAGKGLSKAEREKYMDDLADRLISASEKPPLQEWENIKTEAKRLAQGVPEAEIARGQGEMPGIEAPIEVAQAGRLSPVEIREATELGIPLQPPGNEEAMRTAIAQGTERGFARTVRTAEVTPGVIREELTQHPRTYDPITNADTVREAQDLINTDLGKATRLILDSDEAPDALTTVTGELLAHRLIRSADTAQQDEGLRILDKLFERATTGGQGIQAFSIYGRLTPEGNLLYVQRIVKQAQKQFPEVKLTKEKAQEFLKRAEALQAMDEGREKVLASAELLRDEYGLLPRSLLSKVALAQTLAQLLNPKTAVRNIFGNLLFWPAENLSRLLAMGYDIPISLVTGKRSVVAPNIGLQIRAAGRGTMEAIEEVGRDLNLRNLPTQFDLTTGKGFQQMGPQFQGVPILGGLERALSYELRVPDRAFFEAAFDDGLWNWAQVTAKNEGGDAMALFAKPSKEGIEAAYLEGLYRTFQDESVAAVAFSGIKRAFNLNQDFGLGDLILKYPRTPGNLLARGIEYTPFGFFQALFDVAQKGFRGKAFNQQAFVETLGRATVGTVGLTVPGAYLASLGILTGRGPRDKDVRALQRESGERPYTFNLSAYKRLIFSGFNPQLAKRREGDKLISYDWALPLSLPIAMAAEAGTPQPKKLGKREAPSILADLSDNLFLQMGVAGLDALATGIDTIATQPMTQGLQKLFGSDNLYDNLVAVLSSLPSSFTPSVLNQVQQLVDNTMKETWRPEKWEEGLTTVLARVPILAATLPDRLNVWGEPADRYQNDTNNPWNVFVNPAFIGEYLPRPEAEMVLALHEATGQTVHFPRVASRTLTVGGRQYELTPAQLVEYQGLLGQATRKAFSEVAQSESFRKADPEEQVKFLARVLNELNYNAKLTLHERYTEASGAVNPLPKSTDTQGAFGKYITQDAAQVWKDQETLKPYWAVAESLQASFEPYARIQAKHDLLEKQKDVVGLAALERDILWKAYQKSISDKRESLRRTNKEIERILTTQLEYKPVQPEKGPYPLIQPLKPLQPIRGR